MAYFPVLLLVATNPGDATDVTEVYDITRQRFQVLQQQRKVGMMYRHGYVTCNTSKQHS